LGFSLTMPEGCRKKSAAANERELIIPMSLRSTSGRKGSMR